MLSATACASASAPAGTVRRVRRPQRVRLTNRGRRQAEQVELMRRPVDASRRSSSPASSTPSTSRHQPRPTGAVHPDLVRRLGDRRALAALRRGSSTASPRSASIPERLGDDRRAPNGEPVPAARRIDGVAVDEMAIQRSRRPAEYAGGDPGPLAQRTPSAGEASAATHLRDRHPQRRPHRRRRPPDRDEVGRVPRQPPWTASAPTAATITCPPTCRPALRTARP